MSVPWAIHSFRYDVSDCTWEAKFTSCVAAGLFFPIEASSPSNFTSIISLDAFQSIHVGQQRRARNLETKHAEHAHVENQPKRPQPVQRRGLTHAQVERAPASSWHQLSNTTASEPTSMIIALAGDLESSDDKASNRNGNGTEAHQPIHRPRLHVASLTQ